MARDKGQEVAVVATAQDVVISDSAGDYTFVNRGTKDLFYRLKDANTMAGIASAIVKTPIFGIRLKATESIPVKGGTWEVCCATGETTTLQVMSGKGLGVVAGSGESPSMETIIWDCDDHTLFAAVNDATTIANQTSHITGTSAVKWAKAGTHVNSGITDTFPSLDLSGFGPNDYVSVCVNVTDISEIATLVLRLGTDASNYTEFQWDDSELTTGWQVLSKKLYDFESVTGTGIQPAAVTYGSLYFIFDGAANTLVDITVDHLSYITAEAIATDLSDLETLITATNVLLTAGTLALDIIKAPFADVVSVLYDGGGASNILQVEADTAAVVAGGAAVIDIGNRNVLDIQLVNDTAVQSCKLWITEFSAAAVSVINQTRQQEITVGITDHGGNPDLQMVGEATAVGYAKAPIPVDVTPNHYAVISMESDLAGGQWWARYGIRGRS